MSFRLGLNRVQEALVIALMVVFIFAVTYSDMEFTYKIGIAVLVFTIIFLISMASQAMKQQEEQKKQI
jgi:low affinity Fe/Cu permease